MTTRTAITDSYLQALGIAREAPSLSYLTEIARRHLATFSFASIGPRLGEDLPLDLASLHERIVVRQRGGYCFEQNGLTYDVLEELGFAVMLVMGRVLLRNPVHPGLTHRFTVVTLPPGRFLVDVGFGPLGPRAPVRLLEADGTDDADAFRVASLHPGEFTLLRRKDGADVPLYRFELSRYGQSDCEIGHFYSHRHPQANFVNNLVACRQLDHETRSLRNREYWILRETGDERRVISSGRELRAVLEADFGLLVSGAEADRLFAELPPRS